MANEASSKNITVLGCSCVSEYQDKKYGPGKRVHNRTKQNMPESSRRWRCTGCGTERG